MVNVNEELVLSLSVNGQRGLHWVGSINVTLGDFMLTRIVHPEMTFRSSFTLPHVVQTHMLLFFQWRI